MGSFAVQKGNKRNEKRRGFSSWLAGAFPTLLSGEE
jgi:hypothetical protein